MNRRWFALGAALCGTAVLLGAFGAHMLAGEVTDARLETFRLATRYQLAHGLALLAVSAAAASWGGRWITAGGILLTTGTLVFSGSLYLLVLLDQSWLGAVTPLGGVALMLGWGALVCGACSRSTDTSA